MNFSTKQFNVTLKQYDVINDYSIFIKNHNDYETTRIYIKKSLFRYYGVVLTNGYIYNIRLEITSIDNSQNITYRSTYDNTHEYCFEVLPDDMNQNQIKHNDLSSSLIYDLSKIGQLHKQDTIEVIENSDLSNTFTNYSINLQIQNFNAVNISLNNDLKKLFYSNLIWPKIDGYEPKRLDVNDLSNIYFRKLSHYSDIPNINIFYYVNEYKYEDVVSTLTNTYNELGITKHSYNTYNIDLSFNGNKNITDISLNYIGFITNKKTININHYDDYKIIPFILKPQGYLFQKNTRIKFSNPSEILKLNSDNIFHVEKDTSKNIFDISFHELDNKNEKKYITNIKTESNNPIFNDLLLFDISFTSKTITVICNNAIIKDSELIIFINDSKENVFNIKSVPSSNTLIIDISDIDLDVNLSNNTNHLYTNNDFNLPNNYIRNILNYKIYDISINHKSDSGFIDVKITNGLDDIRNKFKLLDFNFNISDFTPQSVDGKNVTLISTIDISGFKNPSPLNNTITFGLSNEKFNINNLDISCEIVFTVTKTNKNLSTDIQSGIANGISITCIDDFKKMEIRFNDGGNDTVKHRAFDTMSYTLYSVLKVKYYNDGWITLPGSIRKSSKTVSVFICGQNRFPFGRYNTTSTNKKLYTEGSNCNLGASTSKNSFNIWASTTNNLTKKQIYSLLAKKAEKTNLNTR